MMLRGPGKFALLALVVIVLFVGYRLFVSRPSTATIKHSKFHDAQFRQGSLVDKRTGGKVGVNSLKERIPHQQINPPGSDSHLPSPNSGTKSGVVGKTSGTKSGVVGKTFLRPQQRRPPQQEVQPPVDEEEEEEEEEGIIDDKNINMGVSEEEVATSIKHQCVLDEENVYKDPNIKPLYQVCQMTVKTKNFPEYLNKMDRLVHLDLKGAAPKPAYLEQVFPLMREAGATGLLIEYEDMFPYTGELANLASGDAYSKDDLNKILQAAEKNNLVVMPLVQTFGHLEFLLKHEKFMAYREVENVPQALSPCVKGASTVLKLMLKQVMDFHPKSEYFHIGADEVYHLGQGKCKEQIASGKITKDQLFLNHIREIAEFLKSNKKTPVMWDDMFRHTPLEVLKNIHNLVEPMIWQYSTEVPKYITKEMLIKYSKSFENVWVASSFKGATGSNQYITNTFNHLTNHMTWLKLLDKYREHINFRGFALTGWQRFDHFAILCELLPQAIPSLTVCLQAARYGTINQEMLGPISKTILKMNSTYQLVLPEKPSPNDISGQFPGSAVYNAVMKLHATMYFMNIFEDRHMFKGWATKYHAKYNYYSPGQLQYALGKIPGMMKNFTEIETDMRAAMTGIFYKDTVEEWVMANVEVPIDSLNKYKKYLETAIANSPKFWPGRPFHNKIIPPSDNFRSKRRTTNEVPNQGQATVPQRYRGQAGLETRQSLGKDQGLPQNQGQGLEQNQAQGQGQRPNQAQGLGKDLGSLQNQRQQRIQGFGQNQGQGQGQLQNRIRPGEQAPGLNHGQLQSREQPSKQFQGQVFNQGVNTGQERTQILNSGRGQQKTQMQAKGEGVANNEGINQKIDQLPAQQGNIPVQGGGNPPNTNQGGVAIVDQRHTIERRSIPQVIYPSARKPFVAQIKQRPLNVLGQNVETSGIQAKPVLQNVSNQIVVTSDTQPKQRPPNDSGSNVGTSDTLIKQLLSKGSKPTGVTSDGKTEQQQTNDGRPNVVTPDIQTKPQLPEGSKPTGVTSDGQVKQQKTNVAPNLDRNNTSGPTDGKGNVSSTVVKALNPTAG